jgi:hypothetical protein
MQLVAGLFGQRIKQPFRMGFRDIVEMITSRFPDVQAGVQTKIFQYGIDQPGAVNDDLQLE